MPSSRLCQDFTFSGTKLLIGPHFQEDNFLVCTFFTGPYFLAGPYFFAGLNVLQDHTYFQQDQMFCRTTLLAGPIFQNTHFTLMFCRTTLFSRTKSLQVHRTTLLSGPIFSTHFFTGPDLLQDHTFLAGPNFQRIKL